MSEIRAFHDLSEMRRYTVAEFVAVHNLQHPAAERIAPFSLSDVLRTPRALVALENATIEAEIAGYIRAHETIFHPETEQAFRQIGSLVIHRKFRRRGVGLELVQEMTKHVLAEDAIPFAFANANAQATFVRAGYHRAEAGQIPPEARSAFGNPGMVYAV